MTAHIHSATHSPKRLSHQQLPHAGLTSYAKAFGREPNALPKLCNCFRTKNLAPRARFELATLRLTAECSTVELPGNIPIFICLRGGCKPNAGDMGDMTESKSSIFNASFPRIHASHDLDIRGFRHTFLTVPEPNLD